jgi:hypothetical protein
MAGPMSGERGSPDETVKSEPRLPLADEMTTRVIQPKATVMPTLLGVDPDGARAIELLRRVGSSEGSLEIKATIGEGGMGVVRAARQLALGRDVALKTFREPPNDPESTLRLLREAWITGSLEHPNVVPVYDVSIASDGRPQIVLKKIEGASWSELLRDDTEITRRFGANDALDWHLRTLMQVANAIHFAHSRDIIHRDIKPDNVMIGRFGEVYVLDWGVAVSLVDEGTPAYMAPEMLGASKARLGVHTDVYLLGAVLYEILVGKPPHDGKNFAEIFEAVLSSPIDLPDSVPPELARIVRTAMALDPGGRFEDAQSFRLALTEFLEHRGSLTLAADADERLKALDEAHAGAGGLTGEEQRVQLYRLFAEARMGYGQALRAWPGNERAKLGLRRAVESMVEYELLAGDSRAASVLLSEHPDASPDLQARVDRARAAQEREAQRRAAMEADLDPEHGRGTRLFVGAVLCFFWTVTPLTAWVLEFTGVYHRSPRDVLTGATLITIIAAGLAHWARAALSRTSVNRRLRDAIAITLGSQLALLLAAYSLGIAVWSAATLKLVIYAVVVSHITAAVSRTFWVTVVAYLVALALSARWPQNVFLFEGLSNAVLSIVVIMLWGRSKPAPPVSRGTRRATAA